MSEGDDGVKKGQHERPICQESITRKKQKIDETSDCSHLGVDRVDLHDGVTDRIGHGQITLYPDPIKVLLRNNYIVISIDQIDNNKSAYKMKDGDKNKEYNICISHDNNEESLGESKIDLVLNNIPSAKDIEKMSRLQHKLSTHPNISPTTFYFSPIQPHNNLHQIGENTVNTTTLQNDRESSRLIEEINADETNNACNDLRNEISAINIEINNYILMIRNMTSEIETLYGISDRISQKYDKLVDECEIFHINLSEKLIPRNFSEYYQRTTNSQQFQKEFIESRNLLNYLHFNFTLTHQNFRMIKLLSDEMVNLNSKKRVVFDVAEKIKSIAEIVSLNVPTNTGLIWGCNKTIIGTIRGRWKQKNLRIKSMFLIHKSATKESHLRYLKTIDVTYHDFSPDPTRSPLKFERVSELVSDCPYIDRFGAPPIGKSFNCLSEMLKRHPPIRVLDITVPVINKKLIDMIVSMKKLDTLSLTYDLISYYGSFNDSAPFELFSNLTSLKSFTISNVSPLEFDALDCISDMDNLESLTVTNCVMTSSDYKEIFSKIKRSQRIKTINFYSLKEDESSYDPRHRPDSEELEIDDAEFTLLEPYKLHKYRGVHRDRKGRVTKVAYYAPSRDDDDDDDDDDGDDNPDCYEDYEEEVEYEVNY